MEELGGYQIGAPRRNHEIVNIQDPKSKFQPIDMLKETSSIVGHMTEIAAPKSQEFIDHTLLAPEYIRNSNNFIIDLMDEQVVFQKATAEANAEVDFSQKEQTINTDLQFQNAIFQFVNKHGQIQCSPNDGAPMVVSNDVADASVTFGHKEQPNFMTLGGSFLGDSTDNKHFCGPAADDIVHHQFSSLSTICDLATPNKSNVSDLSMLEDVTLNTSNLIAEPDMICSRSNAKKLLPHKKRITKKLKVPQNGSEYILATSQVEHTENVDRLQEQHVMQFSCELCGHATSSQLDFFSHLKRHYEPIEPNIIKTALNDLQQQKTSSNSTDINAKEVCEHAVAAKQFKHIDVQQVFPDVHINFEDFHQVDDTVAQAISAPNLHDDMKILNSNSIDKCIQFVTQHEIEAPKHISCDEIEFSDTEDMLEGIRNVVDKVSIEDTCDALDMVTSNSMRAPWFANNSFNTISFKSKLIGDSDFSTTAVNNELTMLKADTTKPAATLSIVKLENLMPEVDIKANELDNFNDCDQSINSTKVSSKSNRAKLCNKKRKHSKQNTEADVAEEGSGGGGDCDMVAEEKKLKFHCTKCNREFNSNNALKYHNRTHTGVRPHQCDTCGRSFFAQGALKSHIRTHTGDKPFECEHCQRKFRQMSDLKYHITSIHNDEKSHQCEFCGKAFSRKYSLVLHRRIHTSERNYECEFCPKSFRASIYLQNHRKIHTGEKPYECEVCSKKFRVSGDLRRHLRTHQRKKIKDESPD